MDDASANTFRVELPDDVARFMRERMAEEGHNDASAYIESLVMADLSREDRRRLEKELIESIESGPPMPMDDAYWERLRRFARDRGTDAGRSAA